MAGRFEERVWNIVRKIPRGRVMTYGQVADCARSGTARGVGLAMMKAVEEALDVPTHRVVLVDGRISLLAPSSHKQQLKEEGVTFVWLDRVDLSRHQLLDCP